MLICSQCGATAKDEDRFCARCGAPIKVASDADPLIGRTIGGSFLVQEIIGVGGMGRVYRAEQSTLGRTVAIKVIHHHLLSDAQTVARFYTEARAASRLNHPNSVGIIDFGRTDDGLVYLVMEHLSGKDLSRVMAEEGPLPFGRICDIMTGVLAALQEAHELGIVHRDLKPENIILKAGRSGPESVKVVDFGLATITSTTGASTSITAPGIVCGTPDYMSPEQGRGDPLDGRSDIYAAGVLLFEMLTERLPFADETPTKVVLRHIQDPIPNPNEVAPYRAIPESLADVATKALAKNPSDRFQTAAEMLASIRRVAESVRPTSRAATLCPECGARQSAGMRFCGSCGARLQPTQTVPPSRLSFASLPPASGHQRAFLARDQELGELDAMRISATGKTVRARIIGEPGVGKTRLMRELAERAAAEGDFVAVVGPHPSGAPVSYWPIRCAVAILLDVQESALAAAALHSMFDEPLARSGMEELVDPVGLLGMPGMSRSGAVASAVAVATRVAASRSKSKRVCFFVDDLPRCDGLTRQVLADLPNYASGDSLFVLSTGNAPDPTDERAATFMLQGFTVNEIGAFLSSDNRTASPLALFDGNQDGERRALPLYLEHVAALASVVGPDEPVPARLADAVAMRLERIDLRARRALQVLSVLGDRTTFERYRAVAGLSGPESEGLTTLERKGWISTAGDIIHITHPFVRNLVEASIPAEARKRLHDQVLQYLSDIDAPLEERAEHAARGLEATTALVLLEKMGDAAVMRGDAHSGILAFRRGLDVARQEALDTGEAMLDHAVLTFSRRLGDVLERFGDALGADGVLREAVDLAGPNSIERGRILLVLARVAMRRERRREAIRLLGQALEIAAKNNDLDLETGTQSLLAKARREEGDTPGAEQAYRAAVTLSEKLDDALMRRARAEYEFAEYLMDANESAQATARLELSVDLSMRANALALAACAMGSLGTIHELEGDTIRAVARYKEASRLASVAGDADASHKWDRAASAMSKS